MSIDIRLCTTFAILGVVWSPAEALKSTEPYFAQGAAATTAVGWSDAVEPARHVLTDIVTWLSMNFELPANYEHPRVEFVPARQVLSMRYNGFLPDGRLGDGTRHPVESEGGQSDVVAVYDDKTETIFVADTWTGTTPTNISVLVHEMVHHLQNVGGFRYECPEAREKLAYQAQARWLEKYGKSLEEEFNIDKFTIFVKSMCAN